MMIAFPRRRDLDELDDSILDQSERVLHAVRAIDLDALERLVQFTHECTGKEDVAPPERFRVSRQALRMLWLFRRNLENTDVNREVAR